MKNQGDSSFPADGHTTILNNTNNMSKTNESGRILTIRINPYRNTNNDSQETNNDNQETNNDNQETNNDSQETNNNCQEKVQQKRRLGAELDSL